MKVVAVLLVTLVVVYGHPEKRFFIHDLINEFHSLHDQLHVIINNAREQFDQLTAGINVNFDDVVDALIQQIDAGFTEDGCSHACENSAAAILGPAAPMANLVCAPVCKAALAKLEEAAV